MTKMEAAPFAFSVEGGLVGGGKVHQELYMQ